jgi:hypothetical protein
MKTKPKLRARRMWASYYKGGFVFLDEKRNYALDNAAKDYLHAAIPVAVIPLHEPTALGDSMVSALTSLGVLPKQRKGGRK